MNSRVYDLHSITFRFGDLEITSGPGKKRTMRVFTPLQMAIIASCARELPSGRSMPEAVMAQGQDPSIQQGAVYGFGYHPQGGNLKTGERTRKRADQRSPPFKGRAIQ